MERALPEAPRLAARSFRPHDAKEFNDPRFQAGTAPCSRLPRLDPIPTVDDRPGGPPTALGCSRGFQSPCQDVGKPALGASAIDEICEHTARSRIPVDFASEAWRLEAVSVFSARPLPPLARSLRPSPGVARRAIASFYSGGWGLRPMPIVSLGGVAQSGCPVARRPNLVGQLHPRERRRFDGRLSSPGGSFREVETSRRLDLRAEEPHLSTPAKEKRVAAPRRLPLSYRLRPEPRATE